METVRTVFHRCFVGLCMLAMVVALVAAPAGVAFATASTMVMADNGDEAPCDHPCPGCAKPCPDMANCLLKCFQQLTPISAQANFAYFMGRSLVPPALDRKGAETPIPPLLRPPSV
jgi:hypothetical protein